MGRPEITVIVPTRNRAALLERTLRSVLANDVDLEIVVVDEASEDDTVETVAALADARIRLLRHDRPRGVAGARNHGIAEARAPWLAFSDDDDLSAPDRLRSQIAAMTTDAAGWCVTGSVYVDLELDLLRHDRAPVGPDLAERLRVHNVVPGGGSAVAVRADLARELGGFDERFNGVEDWDLWMRLAEHGLPAAVDRPLLAYTIHPSGSSRARDAMRAEVEQLRRLKGLEEPASSSTSLDDWTARLQLRAELRAGRRLRPAVRLVRSARATRLGTTAGLRQVAAALLAPRGLAGRLDLDRKRQLPPGWCDELETWLWSVNRDRRD